MQFALKKYDYTYIYIYDRINIKLIFNLLSHVNIIKLL